MFDLDTILQKQQKLILVLDALRARTNDDFNYTQPSVRVKTYRELYFLIPYFLSLNGIFFLNIKNLIMYYLNENKGDLKNCNKRGQERINR
ncbi:hypothetical protein AWN65_07150 [Flavobacterium covae]|nr:hypothetical protein AWN65_07150 [Flavobacterium covae]